MEKIIKILVNSEEDAFNISQELTELDQNGNISIAESFVLSKDVNGEVSLKDAKGEKTSYTLGGALTGSILGILGGPLGILWGAALGSMLGASGDILSSERKSEYLDRVGKSLPNGKTALLVHLDEYWTVPVDTILKKYNGTISRYDVDEEFEEYVQQELDGIDEDIRQVSEDVRKASEESKVSLYHKLDALKIKRNAFWAKVNEQTHARKKQYQKWLDKMKSNFQDLKEDIQDELEDYKEDITEGIEEIKDELRLSRKKRLEKRIAHQEEKLAKLEGKLERQ